MPDLKYYDVTFSYTVRVKAEDNDDAVNEGMFEYESLRPTVMRMNCETKEVESGHRE